VSVANTLSDLEAEQGGGGGNATVPNDAPIQPAQAFVDVVAANSYATLLLGPTNADLDVSNKGIVSISQSAVTAWQTGANGNGAFGGNFSGNALNVTTINIILSGWATYGDFLANPSTLNLSGPLMAAPTPVHADIIIDVQLPVSLPGNGAVGRIGNNQADFIQWDDGLSGGYSCVNALNPVNDGTMVLIGTGGTRQQIIDQLAGAFPASVSDQGGGKFRLTITNDRVFAYDVSDMGASGITVTIIQAGNAGNADKAALLAEGWTVTTN
jgi:hypothetical protein